MTTAVVVAAVVMKMTMMLHERNEVHSYVMTVRATAANDVAWVLQSDERDEAMQPAVYCLMGLLAQVMHDVGALSVAYVVTANCYVASDSLN